MSNLMVKEESATNGLVEDNRGFMCFTNISEALKYSEIIAKSQFCPPSFSNKPGDVLVAIQFGLEVGLKPIQALQNICVINGKPSIYGDAALALCRAHHSFESCNESFDEATQTASCVIKRKGEPEHVATFSFKDAEKAGLFNKSIWKQYPKRMAQFRARGFALRDVFADVLKGLITREEAADYQNNSNNVRIVNNIQKQEPSNSKIENIEDAIDIDVETGEILTPLDELKSIIESNELEGKVPGWLEYFGAKTLEELNERDIVAIINKVNKEIKESK